MENTKKFDNLFLSAGAMKAGTTWLYATLSKHPDLHFSLEKEIHYFYARSVDFGPLSDRRRLENVRNNYAKIDPDRSHISGVRNRLRWAANYLDNPVDDLWYRNLFVFRRSQKYCCDFSNLYALLPEDAWRHAFNLTDRLRVLYTLRDPISRLWSHVKFHLQITNQAHLLETWAPKDFEAFIRQPFIWENAEYGAAIRRMRSVLPASCLKICTFEDIHNDPKDFLRNLEEFLEVSHLNYSDDALRNRVNVSVSRPMPSFFVGLVERDIKRIIKEVEDQGVEIPEEWNIP
ncbi:sulfotransferase family protein [Albidovulum inexpectatum]|uniref:Sulfotransferase family protein n=1 Tax=Albidovulum inexpectatum TaxID=196587 RepID=A0A2S5JD20_9RHOB|nr:sulfotransferase [Albidovulum inexpectatum]PPB79363.1 sulfotransferase family protein [Albidovulum inexpectatum]